MRTLKLFDILLGTYDKDEIFINKDGIIIHSFINFKFDRDIVFQKKYNKEVLLVDDNIGPLQLKKMLNKWKRSRGKVVADNGKRIEQRIASHNIRFSDFIKECMQLPSITLEVVIYNVDHIELNIVNMITNKYICKMKANININSLNLFFGDNNE